MSENKSSKIFLISFLPAIAYWYLEENYSLKIALIGGVLLAVTELVLEKIFTKHIHSLSKINFLLILGLGIISVVAADGIWFKLQPFFNGIIMGGIFLWSSLNSKSYFFEIMEQTAKIVPPKKIVIKLEKHLAIFMIIYAFFMAFVAFKLSSSQWAFFKTIGLYISFFIFMIIEMVIMRKDMAQHVQELKGNKF